MGKRINEIGDLSPDPANANRGTKRGRAMVEASLRETGAGRSILADKDGRIIAGNKTLGAAAEIGLKVRVVETDGTELVVVQRTDLDLADSAGPARKMAYYDNQSSAVGLDWDTEQMLADLTAGVDLAAMFQEDELDELLAGLRTPEALEDPGAQVDRAEELREQWGVVSGQLWSLDSGKGHAHRLICGDCTDPAVVERVMGGEKAALVHADPPYGMGKENDGIANDNLYREKLDAFQMQWWKACRSSVADNGSAYIWGTDEDLWRLWYMGGLKDSERLTFRNEVVWNKGYGQGMASDSHRMYPTGSERAIFFMLGEQGFNINADNYWDGWEPIRAYLEGEAVRLGIGNAELLRICGVGSMYSHWFTKSQWIFIPEEHYRKLQADAKGDGFKRDYDTLKRDFYATRAYFDNAHDKMIDVWDFPVVQGDDRHGHATPKPVPMMERIIKSSTAKGAVVYAPFGGTAPELIACEKLFRKCRAIELSLAYTAVALERWSVMTGQTPQLITD